MCGIAGVLPLDGNPNRTTAARLRAMADALAHRGPDGDGYYVNPGRIGLAHRRLAIIDVAGGAQPIANEDGSIQVVFNGEIFNYLELRQTLVTRGHRFKTRTDTEVLVHLYEEHGDQFLDHLNGQFAMALWDGRSRRLLLARDRAGILPLFYYRTPHEIVFASEIKAILAALPGSPSLNPNGLRQILTFWAPLGPETAFEGTLEVEPGHVLTAENGGVRTRPYWEWMLARDGEGRTGPVDALTEELGALLDDATRIRLRADVPVGAYLSGGLDSSVLTALAARAAGSRLRTFSVGFADPRLDESEYQREVVAAIGAAHSQVTCHDAAVADSFLDVIRAAETPVTRSAPAPMLLLSRHVRASGFKVVLTGEGADEVLGGYDLFKEAKLRAYCARQPASTRRPQLFARLYPYLDFTRQQPASLLQPYFGSTGHSPCDPAYSHRTRWAAGAWAEGFLSADIRSRADPGAVEQRLLQRATDALAGRGLLHRAQWLEARTLMAGYLLASQGDRMLMAHGVEGRFPYLDHRVVEFGNALDPRIKMRALCEKWLLRRVARALVPARVSARPKQPYRAPDVEPFLGRQRPEYVRELTGVRRLRDYGYFDAAKIELLTSKLARAVETGAAVSHRESLAWMTMLSTQAWHYVFHERRAAAQHW
jgi:asparagine synthase (glutamine-hydrolysing)